MKFAHCNQAGCGYNKNTEIRSIWRYGGSGSRSAPNIPYILVRNCTWKAKANIHHASVCPCEGGELPTTIAEEASRHHLVTPSEPSELKKHAMLPGPIHLEVLLSHTHDVQSQCRTSSVEFDLRSIRTSKRILFFTLEDNVIAS